MSRLVPASAAATRWMPAGPQPHRMSEYPLASHRRRPKHRPSPRSWRGLTDESAPVPSPAPTVQLELPVAP